MNNQEYNRSGGVNRHHSTLRQNEHNFKDR